MSRYFERADHCARVLEANYNLMLNPSKLSTEERWHRIMASLGIAAAANGIDPQMAMIKLTSDPDDESSIVSCIAESRENAGQVREQISSEMWERLNSLYHQVTQANSRLGPDSDPLRLVAAVREGSYQFHGVTDATMNHGEGWHFIQLGKYMERSCAVSYTHLLFLASKAHQRPSRYASNQALKSIGASVTGTRMSPRYPVA